MAGRYATALFELALEANALDRIEEELSTFASMLEASSDLRRLVLSPVFTADEQMQGIEAVADKAGIGGLTADFLGLIARNRRLFAVADMIDGFRRLAARHRGHVTAEVTSASELSSGQAKALKAALEASIDQEVRIDSHIDPSLLGGLVVRVGSRMIDTSLRTKLNNLRVAMREVG